MTRSRRWAVPAALGLASACLLAPAAAYSPAEEDPVELDAKAEESPVVEPGVHPVLLPPGEDESFLRVERKMDGSTVWLGQNYVSPKLENSWVTLGAEDGGEDGADKCDYEDFQGSDYHGHTFMTGGVRIDPRCQNGATVTFSERPSTDFTLGGEEGQVFVWEEPPVENRDVLPPPATESAWDFAGVASEGDLELGATYADAPEVTEGKYTVHVDPGEPALFRTDLDWNQHLQVDATYDGKGAGDALLYPILINPIGATSSWGSSTDAPGTDTILTSIPGSEASLVSPSITWRNREADGNTAAFPGSYYVLLRLGTKDAPKVGADLTLSVKVITDKDAESPYESEYADAATPPDISGHDTGEDEATSEDASDPGSTPWVAVGGLLAGAVVFAGAGGVSLSRHRRSRGSPGSMA